MRILVRVALMVAFVAVAVFALASPAAGADGSGLGLTLAVRQAEPVAGTDIPIELTVVNRSPVPCQIAAMADGTVRVTEVRHDGTPLEAAFSEIRYTVPLVQQAVDSVRMLAPGGQETFAMAAAKRDGRLVLSAVDSLPNGGGISSDWTLAAPGRYRISAVYSAPQAIGQSPCRGSSEVANVEFTIRDKPAAGTKVPWLWIIVGAVGLLVLAGLLWLVLRRGKRAATAGMLVIACVASGLAAGQRPADAEVKAAGEPGEFLDTAVALSGCMRIFRSPGGDPAKILPVLDRQGVNVKVRPRKAGDQTDSYVHKGGQTVYWDNNDKKTMLDKGGVLESDPGTLTDPCAELYHELAHAKEYNATGKTDKQPCGNLVLETTEAAATLAENQYRASRKPPLDQRRSYGPYSLPKSMKDCENRPPTAQKPGNQCTPAVANAAQPSGCDKEVPPEPDHGKPAMSNGDPHLITLDGRLYDFQAVGEFVAVESNAGDFAIQTRQTAVPDSRSVAVNTAAAFKVGPDRLQLAVANGNIALWVNGKPQEWAPGARPLPGGGKAARRPSPIGFNQDGYTIRWPDGSLAWVDLVGGWGLRLYVLLAEARTGTVRGLLGDFDGNADNDLRPRGGEPLREISREGLYGAFGNGWRVSPGESLFVYNAGETTETFTDRAFPAKVVGVPQLDAARREAALAICEGVGITDPAQLDACVLDVALTGQAAFAVNTLDIQTNPVVARQGRPSGAIRDGDLVTGEVTNAGEARRYTLELDGAQDFFVADWHGISEGCDQAFFVNLIDVSNANQPCTNGSVRFHVDDPAKTYQLEIVAKPRQWGGFRFRLVTVKPRVSPVAIGERIAGAIDVRGRENRHEFDSGGASEVRLTGLTTDCSTNLVADLFDVTDNRVSAAGRLLCGESVQFALENPAHRYAILIAANNVGTGSYAFTVQRV